MIKQILIALILLGSFVNATTETIDLREGDSFLIRDRNVTIIDTNKDDKVKICINNLMSIISDNDEKLFNGVYVDIRHIENNITNVRLERNCIERDCSCDENCNNNRCFDKENKSLEDFVPEESKIKEEIIVSKKESNISNLGINNDIINYLGIFLLLIVFIFILLKFNK
ncbi:hypothetical protein HYX17_04340 [Candidatus Woesearchaeota archaeon]|nr:hypothetical protein [Candidatus Woesearchaeota archaeon]